MLEANIRDNQELSQLIQQANSKREAIAGGYCIAIANGLLVWLWRASFTLSYRN